MSARFLPGFLGRAVVAPAIVVAFLLGAGALDAPQAPEAPVSTPTTTGPDPEAAARAYASQNGLTACTDPSRADLDDVILAAPVAEDGFTPDASRIVEIDFDEALASAGVRVNILACEVA